MSMQPPTSHRPKQWHTHQLLQQQNPSQNQHQPQPAQYALLPSGSEQSQSGTAQVQQQNISTLSALPYIPPHLVQDALRMCAPVGSSANDEAIMVQILYEAPMTGQTYKQALESLHGINNHAATLWKDYYLDHKPRIDRLVKSRAERDITSRAEQNGAVTTPTSPPQVAMQVSHAPQTKPTKRTSTRHTSASSRHKRHGHSIPQPSVQRGRPIKRHTINSLTTHAMVQTVPNLLPPQPDIVLPPVPSRSPSPPTIIIPDPRGYKYTQEDRDYFIKFISWRLNCNPELTKNELCALLAEKAPHHTLASWQSHWHNRHDIADKILAAAKGELTSTSAHDSDSSDVHNPSPLARRTRYDVDYSSASESSERDVSEPGDDLVLVDVDIEEDVINMGYSGGPFTDADSRMVARHINSTTDFDTKTSRLRWESFENLYPQRSWQSWAEYFRKNEQRLRKLARKMKANQLELATSGRSQASKQSASRAGRDDLRRERIKKRPYVENSDPEVDAEVGRYF